MHSAVLTPALARARIDDLHREAAQRHVVAQMATGGTVDVSLTKTMHAVRAAFTRAPAQPTSARVEAEPCCPSPCPAP